jgi:hypothetical protein
MMIFMEIKDVEIVGCSQSIRKEIEAICDSSKENEKEKVSNQKKSNSLTNLLRLFFNLKKL